MNKVFFCFIIPFVFYAQNPSLGIYYGTSLGYNSIYPSLYENMGLFDFSLNSNESFLTSVLMINDNDLSNNNELINGSLIGFRVTLPIMTSFYIQPFARSPSLDNLIPWMSVAIPFGLVAFIAGYLFGKFR